MSRKRSNTPRHRRYDPRAVLAYIVTYKQQHNQRSPSEREIQAALKISAPSVVHNTLRRLEDAELLTITRYGRGQRSDFTLTTTGQATVERWQAEQYPTDNSSPAKQK